MLRDAFQPPSQPDYLLDPQLAPLLHPLEVPVSENSTYLDVPISLTIIILMIDDYTGDWFKSFLEDPPKVLCSLSLHEFLRDFSSNNLLIQYFFTVTILRKIGQSGTVLAECDFEDGECPTDFINLPSEHNNQWIRINVSTYVILVAIDMISWYYLLLLFSKFTFFGAMFIFNNMSFKIYTFGNRLCSSVFVLELIKFEHVKCLALCYVYDHMVWLWRWRNANKKSST